MESVRDSGSTMWFNSTKSVMISTFVTTIKMVIFGVLHRETGFPV